MRFIGRALVASAFVLGACAGGNNNATTDTSAAAATPAATTPSAAPASPAGAPAGGAGVAAAPATGKTVEVKMVGDEKGYRFEPSNITVKQGDAIKFTVVSMPPHNVGFDAAGISTDVQNQIAANMPDGAAPMNKGGPLEGPLLMQPNESYTISFAKVAPGTYNIHCTPHLALNMKGTITVQ
jgi:plastocyanin